MNFWSQGATQARFLDHEGYFGAVGALVSGPVPVHGGSGHALSTVAPVLHSGSAAAAAAADVESASRSGPGSSSS